MTTALNVDCPTCGQRSGNACIGGVFHQERLDAAVTADFSGYRDRGSSSTTPSSVEGGLRDVLTTLNPFDEDETTSILLAVAALYDLPICRKEEQSDE